MPKLYIRTKHIDVLIYVKRHFDDNLSYFQREGIYHILVDFEILQEWEINALELSMSNDRFTILDDKLAREFFDENQVLHNQSIMTKIKNIFKK